MDMRDVIVVGCGILGATISAALSNQGREVLTLDDSRPMGGTGPSGGHLRPSWFRGMKPSEYEPAMELLDATWGLIKEEFTLRPANLGVEVYRVDTDKVLAYPRTRATVLSIRQIHNYPIVRFGVEEERCRLLVVATGVWAYELLPEVQTKSKQGVSFRIRGEIPAPFIKPWAPFKQIVAHQQGPKEIWVGDGTAILSHNWNQGREETCLSRCSSALSLPKIEVLQKRVGWRPYCATGGDPCLLRQLGPRAWIATGAGKLGTIAAGWAAKRITDC